MFQTTSLGNSRIHLFHLTYLLNEYDYSLDLRKLENLETYLPKQLKTPIGNLKFIRACLGEIFPLLDEQGYLASGVQLYATNDITIKENILVFIPLYFSHSVLYIIPDL